MSPILTGVIASGISGNLTPPWSPEGAYDALATVTVPSGGTASVVFAGIPTGYKHLQIRYLTKSAGSNATDSIRLQLNGDNGSNYAYHALFGTGSGSAGSTATTIGAFGAAKAGQLSLSSNIFSTGIIDILDYSSSSKLKTIRSFSGVDFNGSGVIALESNFWSNTAAVTSVTFTYPNLFDINSSFALYGVK